MPFIHEHDVSNATKTDFIISFLYGFLFECEYDHVYVSVCVLENALLFYDSSILWVRGLLVLMSLCRTPSYIQVNTTTLLNTRRKKKLQLHESKHLFV